MASVKSDLSPVNFYKYIFRGHTGYLVAPWLPGLAQRPVAIRHSASVPPWTDADIHLHHEAEEYYFLLQGELQILLAGSLLTLKPNEFLVVKPGISHAVIGGKGPIEHFIIRAPAVDDRQIVGNIPAQLPEKDDEPERDWRYPWGCRVSLTEANYQNCWLFGLGQACYPSEKICLAYLNSPTVEAADANGNNHPHHLHLHQASWEYYTVLQGTKILQIEDDLIEIHAGETLEVPPQVRHMRQTIIAPFKGFTFRTPCLNDKVLC